MAKQFHKQKNYNVYKSKEMIVKCLFIPGWPILYLFRHHVDDIFDKFEELPDTDTEIHKGSNRVTYRGEFD